MRLQRAACALALLFCLGFLGAATSHAALLAQHVGNVDPTTEGWIETPNTGGTIDVFPIDDNGVLAWSVDDQSMVAGSTYTYHQDIADDQIADGNNFGWELTLGLRLLWSEETDDGTIFAGYRDGTTAWQMNFGFDGDENTVVKLFTDISGPILGPTFTVPADEMHHLYSLKYDPLNGTADFFVDGIQQISDYIGYATTDKHIIFGAGQVPTQGVGKFNLVALNTVPEPSTWVLAVMGACALLFARRRRK
jgi:hypothetical protein